MTLSPGIRFNQTIMELVKPTKRLTKTYRFGSPLAQILKETLLPDLEWEENKQTEVEEI